MKRTLILAAFILTAAMGYSQTQELDSSKIREAEINIMGGTLSINATQDKRSMVQVSNMDTANCYAYINLKRDKELEVKIRPLTGNFFCKADVKLFIPAKTDLYIEAKDTVVDILNMRRDISLDIQNGAANIVNYEGALDIENMASDVKATGIIKELDLESRGGQTHITWTKKPAFLDIEVEGNGDVVLLFPQGTDTSKIKVDTKKFTGTHRVINN